MEAKSQDLPGEINKARDPGDMRFVWVQMQLKAFESIQQEGGILSYLG